MTASNVVWIGARVLEHIEQLLAHAYNICSRLRWLANHPTVWRCLHVLQSGKDGMSFRFRRSSQEAECRVCDMCPSQE